MLHQDLKLDGKAKIHSYRFLLNEFLSLGLPSITHAEALLCQEENRPYFLLRHDVDHSLEMALIMAQIEHEMGIKATYFLLPPGDYDKDNNYYGTIVNKEIQHTERLAEVSKIIVGLGHEIGLHNDFVQLSTKLGRSVQTLIREEIEYFKSIGIQIVGSASHGSTYVRQHQFTNYEIFVETLNSAEKKRVVDLSNGESFEMYSIPMESVGLQYEAYFLKREVYITDTGSEFFVKSEYVETVKNGYIKQMSGDMRYVVALIHPEWWKPIESIELKEVSLQEQLTQEKVNADVNNRNNKGFMSRLKNGVLELVNSSKGGIAQPHSQLHKEEIGLATKQIANTNLPQENTTQLVVESTNITKIDDSRFNIQVQLRVDGGRVRIESDVKPIQDQVGLISTRDNSAPSRKLDTEKVKVVVSNDKQQSSVDGNTPPNVTIDYGQTIASSDACVAMVDGVFKSLAEYFYQPEIDGDLTSKRYTPMLIATDDLRDFNAWENHIKTLGNGKRLNVKRKAQKMGYVFKEFVWKMHIPDVCEVNHSKENRSGGAMRGAYLKSVEEMGGGPDKRYELTDPNCRVHWGKTFGVFLPVEGHMQGAVNVGEKLVAYLSLRRYGQFAIYSMIMGHGDHLNNGILVLLHHEMIRWISEQMENGYTQGLRYVMYGGVENGGEGLAQFKRWSGFTPHRVIGYRGVKWREKFALSEKHTLTYDSETLEEVRKNANPKGFPIEYFSSKDKVLSLFSASFKGKNDVIHLVDAGVKSIVCNDAVSDSLEDLRAAYGNIVEEYVLGDAFELVSVYQKQGRKFTSIVADPYVGLMLKVWEHIGDFLSISEHYAVIGITGEYMQELRFTLESVGDWLNFKGVSNWKGVSLTLRNPNSYGGVYWITLENQSFTVN